MDHVPDSQEGAEIGGPNHAVVLNAAPLTIGASTYTGPVGGVALRTSS